VVVVVVVGRVRGAPRSEEASTGSSLGSRAFIEQNLASST
jgi:hypothetical protein